MEEKLTRPPIIRFEHIGRDFGPLSVIRDADFAIRAGEVVRLFGSNGSGKTVLLNLMSGYVLPTRGNLYFAEQAATGLPPWRLARAGVRRSFQFPHVVAALRVCPESFDS
ncbi:MAG: ATP-binding cassette domain-containing protein [Alphaproteobacteria bacterium]